MRQKDLNKDKAKTNRAVYLMSTTPDGTVFMAWLERQQTKLLKTNAEGRVDPLALAASAARHDLVNTIKDMIEDGKLAR